MTTRHDPTGKRALFESPVEASPERLRAGAREGRDAFFSSGGREAGTVVVECSSCDARSRVGLGDIAVRLASLSLYLPLLRPSHPHRITCPSCERATWCRIGWRD